MLCCVLIDAEEIFPTLQSINRSCWHGGVSPYLCLECRRSSKICRIMFLVRICRAGASGNRHRSGLHEQTDLLSWRRTWNEKHRSCLVVCTLWHVVISFGSIYKSDARLSWLRPNESMSSTRHFNSAVANFRTTGMSSAEKYPDPDFWLPIFFGGRTNKEQTHCR